MNSVSAAGGSNLLRRFARVIAVPLGALASLSTLAIMVAIVIDVIARNAGGRSIPGLLEMSESALVATVFLGLAYAGVTNAHVAVDLLTEALPEKVSRILIGFSWILGVLITAWFVLATLERAVQSTTSNELRQGLVDWPLWPSRWLVVIGFAAFLVVAVINVILIIRGEPLLGEDVVDPDLAAAQSARLGDQPGAGADTGTEGGDAGPPRPPGDDRDSPGDDRDSPGDDRDAGPATGTSHRPEEGRP